MANKFGFDKVIKNFEQMKRDLPVILGNDSVKFFQNNFRKQGFEDSSLSLWPKRKNDKDPGRATMTKTGRLKRSIRRSYTSFPKTIVSTDVPYAKIHNEGGKINRSAHSRSKTITAKVKGSSGFVNGKFTKGRSKTIKLKGEAYSVSGHAVNMPKRQFMGHSNNLERQHLDKIDKSFRKIWT